MFKKMLLFSLLSCLAFGLVLPAMAYTTGVKSGDWIKYDFDISIMGVSYKGTMKVTIQSVTTTSITGIVEYTGNFPGAPPSTSFTIDIATWSGGSFFIIPSNLNKGDYIPGGMTVQDVVDWQGRKACKVNTDLIGMGFPVEVYWDQATGVLLEMKGSYSYPGVGSATLSIKATDTNMFSLGLGWLLWVIIIVVVVVVVAVVAVILLRRRKPPTAPPSPVQPTPPPPPPPTQ